MVLSIEPYSSVGKVKFGMQVKQVRAIAGKPENSHIWGTLTHEIRHGIGYQYDSGRLACITLDSSALMQNEVDIFERRLFHALIENLQLLNSLTKQQIKVRNPSMYIYPE